MGAKENQPSESMYKSLHADIHTMFNSMYGEMVNKNWLADTFGDVPGSALKEFKYRRLPYNLGYVRNADLKRKIVKELYVDSNDTYAKKVVEKYTDLDIENVLVIDDSNTTKAGETIKDLITDARSQAKKQLDKLKDDKKITTEQYKEKREDAYPDWQTQMDMQYWDSVNGTTTWKDAIAKVKSDNPKPS